ncbi:amino acid adenylation domain-containing protein [Streptomyces sp. NPDC020298]|uniref:non-ribosomal peptide synthetase n=1 Tax=unclassified Streptomyces TaxID=2593676 RepID=UPI0034060C80
MPYSPSVIGTVRASRKEEALWLLEGLVPETGVNNLSIAFRVESPLSIPLLEKTLTHLIGRHEILRTVFHAEETGIRRGVLGAGEAAVPVARTVLDGPADRVGETLTRFVARPFALDGTPLLRAGYFEHPAGDHFCLAVHHLVFDTTSAVVLTGEIAAAYTALAAGEDLPAALQGRGPVRAETPASEKSFAYWRDRLAGAQPQDLELNYGKPDRGEQPTLEGGQVTVPLPADAVATVRRLTKELRAPEAVVLLAAYATLLAGHGAGTDTVIGSPVDVRGRKELGALGYHVNVLPLRIPHRPEESFRHLVRRTRDTFFDALRHSDVPVDHLLSEIPRSTSSWRHTLFRHVFNYVPQNGPAEFSLGEVRAVPVTVENGSSKFDLEFFLLPTADGITLRLVYGTQLLDRAHAEALAARYGALLTALGADPDRAVGTVAQCGPGDRAVVDAANATDAPEGPDVPAQIAERAARTPDAVAVEDGERQVTYGQLWNTARRTARLLREHGVTPGGLVAVHAPRSPELAAAVLGIWLTGAAYVPLDPDHPRQRVEYQLADSATPLVLTGPAGEVPPAPGREVLPMLPVTDEPAPADDRQAEAPGDGTPAYLIYTSGSTGRPKGTVVGHGALANLIAHFAAELAVTPADATLWLTTFTFDISALELFLPLTSGGRLVVAPDDSRLDGVALGALLERHDVGIVQATPTTWRLVTDDAAEALAGRRVLCGGEPMPVQLAQRLLDTGCELRNVYGPTETTIWSTTALVTADRIGPDDTAVEVGAPLRNTQVFVAALNGTELPVGVAGELCIAGTGVALGYHGRPELTAERFGTHPEYGRFYRTGDTARWRADGRIELLGRSDRQIKLRGNRIELGEVESVLLAHPDVATAAVVVAGDTSADGVLVAFVQPRAGAGAGLEDALWEYARAELVGASVPHHFELVETLPTTANEKTDYPALARRAADWHAADRDTATAAPAAESADPLVREIVGYFRELLGSERVDATSNFFTSGGYSLLAAQLAQRIGASTGVRLRLAQVFAQPTPTDLAEAVRSQRAAA